MKRKILIGVSIMVVMLFLIQPVASINLSDFETKLTETAPDVRPVNEVEIPDIKDDIQIIKKIKTPKPFREKMEENRQRMQMLVPDVPIPEYDYDKMLITLNDDQEVAFDQPIGTVDINNDQMGMFKFGTPSSSSSSTKTRAAAADLELTQLEWENAINDGWGSYTESDTLPGNNPQFGSFMVGEETTITVTVVNHNPTTLLSGIRINWTILDFYAGNPLIKVPTQSAPFNVAGATTTVDFKFTPEAGNTLLISASLNYPDDTDPSNNGIGIWGAQVIVWAADFDAGTGDGSQSPNTWTGDLGATDQWHKTATADIQASNDHTKPNSFYHGTDGTPDSYDDSTTTEVGLESPEIDMGATTDKVHIITPSEHVDLFGDPGLNTYFGFATPFWSGLWTGELEAPTVPQSPAEDFDFVYTYQYSDDNAANWKEPISRWGYRGYIIGDWTTIWTGQTVPTWNPNIYMTSATTAGYGFPYTLFVGTGAGSIEPSPNGATNFSQVQFRAYYQGDGQSDALSSQHGIYGDDFISWGYQPWLPPYSVRLDEVSPVTQQSGGNDVPLLTPNVPAKFEVTVENMGETLPSVDVKVTIKDGSGNTVFGPQKKQISNIATDDKAIVTWTEWTPSGEGDFYISIEVGDLTLDYSPLLNDAELKVYVRNPGARVLVVDDDNSMHNNGIFFKDVEWKMLDSLFDLGITYQVYTVGRNETGPTKTIMNNYEAVIWMTGLDNEWNNYGTNPTNFGSNWGITFKPEDQTQISSWLNDGKKNFWAISPGVLYDLTDSKNAATPQGFLKDYLHVSYANANETVTDSNGDITTQGTPKVLKGKTDSLADGTNYNTYDTVLEEQFGDMGGVIDVDNKGEAVFYQDLNQQAINSLQYSENYNLVYFGFNYYLINSRDDRKDLTYRVMNFFGLEGGLDVDLDDDFKKTIKFGETVKFKFKVTNTGLMEDTMNVKLVTPAPGNLPSGWTIKVNGELPTATTNQITVAGNLGTEEFELTVEAPGEYLDKDGNMDTDYDNTSAGSEIQFKVRVESANYPDNFFDFGACKVEMDLDGDVKLTADETTGTIDISQDLDGDDHYVEYSIMLRNVTNGDEDYSVLVTIDNPTEIVADVLQGGTVITDGAVTLVPRMDVEVTVRVTADEHEPADDYEITFKVMDSTGTVELNSTDITTTVKQYFNIAIVESDDSSMTYSRLIDPNAMTTDLQTEVFEVIIENHGNGPDTVTIEWTENRDSPNAIPLDWENQLVEIYDKDDDSDEIEDIEVPAYDKTSGTPGTITLLIRIDIPKEEQEGRFWIDIKVESSAPRSFINNLVREDYEVEANWTFQIQMVLPELLFDTDASKVLKADGTQYLEGIDSITEDDSITLAIYVKNTGSAPATDVTVEFTVTLNNLAVPGYSEVITLEAGASGNVSWDFLTDDKGTYYFKVKIDPNNEILGDNQQDNTWNKYLTVKEKDKTPPPGPGGIDLTSEEGGLSTTAVALIVIIIIVIVVVIIVFFLFIQKKKSEDEMDDITMMGGPMGMQPGMGMPQGGMMGGAGGMPPAGGMHPGMGPGAGVAAAPEIKALSPQTKKALPPASSEAGINACSSCGESNPPENKFCQGCGGKL